MSASSFRCSRIARAVRRSSAAARQDEAQGDLGQVGHAYGGLGMARDPGASDPTGWRAVQRGLEGTPCDPYTRRRSPRGGGCASPVSDN
jgi:hypothetical protein